MAVLVAIARAIAVAESARAGLVAWILRRALPVAVAKLLLPALGGRPCAGLLRPPRPGSSAAGSRRRAPTLTAPPEGLRRTGRRHWPRCAPCWPASCDLFLRLRRRRRLLLDCPMPCGMCARSPAPGRFDSIWPPIGSGGGGGPWCTSTSGTFCSELMFHFLLLVNDSTFLSHARTSQRSPRSSRGWNQAGFEASVETVSSCTRTCVLMHRSRCDQSANCCSRHLDCHMQPGLPKPAGTRQSAGTSYGNSFTLPLFATRSEVLGGFSPPARLIRCIGIQEQSAEISDLPCNLLPLEKQINRTAIGTHSRFTRQG